MEVSQEFMTSIKRVYYKITGTIHNQLNFFVNHENLNEYLLKIFPVPPSYTREFLTSFSNDQKTVVDFDGFVFMIHKILKNYFVDFPQIMSSGFTFSGSTSINEALIHSCLLLLTPFSSPELFKFIIDSTTSSALFYYIKPEQIEQVYTQYEIFYEQLNSILQKPDPVLPDVSATIQNCREFNLLIPLLEVSREPTKFYKASQIAIKFFEKFFQLGLIQDPTTIFRFNQREAFKIYTIFFALFTFQTNFESYSKILTLYNCSQESLQNFIKQFLNFSISQYETGACEENDESFIFLLTIIKLAYQKLPRFYQGSINRWVPQIFDTVRNQEKDSEHPAYPFSDDRICSI